MVPIVITESGQVEGFSCSRSPSVPAACLSSLHCCWQQSAAGHKTLSQVPGKFFSHEQCLPYDMSVQHPQTKWCCVIVGSSGGFKKLQNSNSEGRVAAVSWRQPQSEEMKKKKKKKKKHDKDSPQFTQPHIRGLAGTIWEDLSSPSSSKPFMLLLQDPFLWGSREMQREGQRCPVAQMVSLNSNICLMDKFRFLEQRKQMLLGSVFEAVLSERV